MNRVIRDKRDLAIEFERINNSTEMWVDKYETKEIARIEYYKALWLSLDSLIREYLSDIDTPLVTDYKNIEDAYRACKIVLEVLRTQASTDSETIKLWAQYEHGLSTAIDALEELAVKDVEKREGAFAFDLQEGM